MCTTFVTMERKRDEKPSTPDSDQDGTAGQQADQSGTKLTFICLASDQSVQATLAAGSQAGTAQTVTDDTKDCDTLAIPDDGKSKQNDAVKLPDCDEAAMEERNTALTNDGQEGSAGDQQKDRSPDAEEESADSDEQDTETSACEGGNTSTATVDVKQRSLSSEETLCPDHPKEKTTAYCDTCDVKACLRCIITEHIPGAHTILPYEDKFEKEDEKLKTLVSSIQEDSEETEELEGALETSEGDYVRDIEDLVAEIEREVQTSRDKLKEKREQEIQKINDAYDKRKEELEQRRQQKIENLRRQEKEQVENIQRRLLESRELRDRSKATTDEWGCSQEGMQLDELKEAVDKATDASTEFKYKKEDLRDIPGTQAEDNEDIVEHGELWARVVTGCIKSREQQTTFSGSVEIKDLQARVKALTKRTPEEYWDKEKTGDVAVKTISLTHNREYACGKRKVPVPVEAPDVPIPLHWDSSETTDVVIMPAEEAEQLAAIVGGGSDLTYCSASLSLKARQGSKEAFAYAFIGRKADNINAQTDEDLNGSNYFLPLSAYLRDSVLQARNLSTTAKLTGFIDRSEIGSSRTVRSWTLKRPRDTTILY